jgi:murein endopeptidase
VQLPERTEYTRRHPSSSWGSSHTIENLIRALASFRHRSGFEGEVVVMAISRRHGRRFPPHDSHQSGRDVDIRLPLLPHVPDTALPNPDEVDWAATWELVRGLADTGAVDAIYLQVELQRRLYQAALWEGMEPEQLGSIIQWPSKSGPDGALVRHEAGHENHMHVRFRCGPAESRCRSR